MSRGSTEPIEPTIRAGRRGRTRDPATAAQDESRRKRNRQLKAPVALPSPPQGMSSFAIEVWESVGDWLVASKRIAHIDRQAFTFFVTHYERFANNMRPFLIGRRPLTALHGSGRDSMPVRMETALDSGKSLVGLARKLGVTAKSRYIDRVATGRPATDSEIEDDREVMPLAMPGWLALTGADDEWHRLVDRVQASELLTIADAPVLAVGSVCFTLYLKVIATGEEETRCYKGHLHKHPFISVASKCQEVCEMIWRDYGMTPEDRAEFGEGASSISTDTSGNLALRMFPNIRN